MNTEKDKLSLQVAHMYYQLEISQQKIADELNISRPTVSRLLKHAKDKGYVQIKVADPFSDVTKLSSLLKEKYDLRDVRVVYVPDTSYQVIGDYIGQAAADYLGEIIVDGDIVGISWGTTMHKIAQRLKPKQVKGVEVVQLKGGISYSNVNTHADEILHLFARAFQTVGRPLPLPVIFDNPEVKRMVEQDRHIQRIITLGRQANVAVFTVGTVRDDALVFRLGYLNDTEKKRLKQRAVGDICSRYYDQSGNIADKTLDSRTIGIDLEELRRKDKAVLVAGGTHKTAAIDAALRGKNANILITDHETADRLVNLQ
ncbi:sugar-binding transcriptional regulator [Vagococcus acidifermentans]|uniref:RNA polymerase subunit sigma-70 n=1 Tax=Vagococcus acidifermentans TaxID=564710 RepID=A0A430B278_9ENTE|nr:sugar-binding transcriptional regulator [Vagococcus acidifermentans]RSU14434.1 RNA polymerase subunit sigma-70 [Vagococcus acidifermentans]